MLIKLSKGRVEGMRRIHDAASTFSALARALVGIQAVGSNSFDNRLISGLAAIPRIDSDIVLRAGAVGSESRSSCLRGL